MNVLSENESERPQNVVVHLIYFLLTLSLRLFLDHFLHCGLLFGRNLRFFRLFGGDDGRSVVNFGISFFDLLELFAVPLDLDSVLLRPLLSIFLGFVQRELQHDVCRRILLSGLLLQFFLERAVFLDQGLYFIIFNLEDFFDFLNLFGETFFFLLLPLARMHKGLRSLDSWTLLLLYLALERDLVV